MTLLRLRYKPRQPRPTLQQPHCVRIASIFPNFNMEPDEGQLDTSALYRTCCSQWKPSSSDLKLSAADA